MENFNSKGPAYLSSLEMGEDGAAFPTQVQNLTKYSESNKKRPSTHSWEGRWDQPYSPLLATDVRFPPSDGNGGQV